MSFTAAYIPIGVPTFHLESAQKEFENSITLLKAIDADVIVPQEMLLSLDKLNAFLDMVNPDYVIVQNATFANGAYTAQILRRFQCPVLLWTLREPVIDGTRLRLNSLTGAYSAANMLKNFGRPFTYVFGSPEDPEVKKTITAALNAAKLRTALKNLRILQIGHTPQGFGFGRALDAEMMTVFGAELLSIEARELINTAKSYSDEDAQAYLNDASEKIFGLMQLPQKNVLDFAKLYKAYTEYVKINHIGAVSSRCWPDFFVDFGTPVCAVLAMLNDMNVPASCETDTYGALTMYAASFLTGKASFFGDPVSMNETENTVTFWHCGTAACSLAREDTGAAAGVHCNRKIGPTLEFGCRPEKEVTVLRIGKTPDGKFRIMTATGEALDKPQQFYGTSIVIKTDCNASDLIYRTVEDGWEPHFVVAMANIRNEIRYLAQMLEIDCVEY